ncbi:LLM class flavin-dependent oxidoreductase [Streptomyces klenkii]|uniref:LLM class flavin-dependent oxidoreductase n=1 Tax=Streptomyces klenkii TaxID=1420899 RepID=UPI0033C35805
MRWSPRWCRGHVRRRASTRTWTRFFPRILLSAAGAAPSCSRATAPRRSVRWPSRLSAAASSPWTPAPRPKAAPSSTAMGPKMLRLAGDRAAGAIPYLVTPEFTAQARETLGAQPFLGPEMKVVLDTDQARARATARDYLTLYLSLPNYTNNLTRAGYTEDDFKGGGSDRLVDALFAFGDAERVRFRIEEFQKAGADHVAVQVVLSEGQIHSELLRQYRELAQALPLRS